MQQTLDENGEVLLQTKQENFVLPAKKSLAILVISNAFLSFILFSVVFLYQVPPLTLVNRESLNNSETEISDGVILVCADRTVILDRESATNLSTANVQNATIGQAREYGWVFDISERNTVVSEFGLECESAWKRPTLQSVYMIGCLVGSIFGGAISDRFGRKYTLTATFIIHICLHLPQSFLTTYTQYIIAIFIAGFVHIVQYLTSYVLAQEIVPPNKRALAALATNICFGVGYLFVPLAAYFIRDWRWFLRAYVIAGVCYFPLLWFIPKSPKWQSTQKYEKSRKSKEDAIELRTTEDNNNKINREMETNERRSSKFLNIFKEPILRKRIILISWMWNVSYLAFYTLSLNSSNLGGSEYLNCALGAVVDLFSYVLMAAIVTKKGRQTSFTFTMGICGVLCLVTPLLRSAHVYAGVAGAMLGKFFATTAMSIIILYTGELFPTSIRNTSYGIASMSARIGSAISPFVIFAGETFDLSIPFYVIGVTSVLSSFLVFLLPETKKAALPDSVDDAIALEANRRKISIRKLSGSFLRRPRS